MSNLGDSNTPISGELFGLPSGWTLTENNDGEAVFEDTQGNVVLRRDATNNRWVTDEIDASSATLDNAVAADQLGIPVYSDDANAPNNTFYYNDTDNQTKFKNASGSIVVTDALSESEVEDIAIKFAVAL